MVLSAESALKRLEELASGLLWVSESDRPLTVVRRGAPPAEAEAVELGVFFARATEAQSWHTADELAVVERYRALVRFLSEELEDARVYRVGAIEVEVLALGRSREGAWLGITTTLIET